ncbi:MAG: hypothetical protein MIL41_05030 [Hyphomicrobiales bacterium]|jgi:hypothetical protein
MDKVLPPLFEPPPHFDLEWRPDADGVTTARTTPVFRQAWVSNFVVLERCGYRAAANRPEFVTWRREDLLPTSRMIACNTMGALGRVETNAHRAVERASVEAERQRPVTSGEMVGIQCALTLMLANRPWFIPDRLLETAGAFANAPTLTRPQVAFMREIYEEAAARLARIDARLASPAGEEAVARVQTPAVRWALLHAVREITALDADRAAERNNSGWDAASSDMGHRLAGRLALDVEAAAPAWAIVHRHRRQISRPLREVLYGTPDVEEEPAVAPAA